MSRNFATTQRDEDAKVRNWGKNLIYHLLNKNFRKYVKLLLNKKRVNETVNLLLPSQTPTSFPYRFRWHIIVSVPEIKFTLMDKTIFSKKHLNEKVKVWVTSRHTTDPGYWIYDLNTFTTITIFSRMASFGKFTIITEINSPD